MLYNCGVMYQIGKMGQLSLGLVKKCFIFYFGILLIGEFVGNLFNNNLMNAFIIMGNLYFIFFIFYKTSAIDWLIKYNHIIAVRKKKSWAIIVAFLFTLIRVSSVVLYKIEFNYDFHGLYFKEDESEFLEYIVFFLCMVCEELLTKIILLRYMSERDRKTPYIYSVICLVFALLHFDFSWVFFVRVIFYITFQFSSLVLFNTYPSIVLCTGFHALWNLPIFL